MKGKYLNEVDASIKKQVEDFERGQNEFEPSEIEETMPKVVEFYNNHPEDQDVYQIKNGCILFIQTPKAIIEKDDSGKPKKDKNGKPILKNKLEKYPSDWGEDSFLLRNCKFRIYNRTENISLFATKAVWTQMGNVYDEMGFIKTSNIRMTYKKIGDDKDVKPMKEKQFLKRYNKLEFKDDEDKYYQSIDEIDDSDYMTFYSTNIIQVIDE